MTEPTAERGAIATPAVPLAGGPLLEVENLRVRYPMMGAVRAAVTRQRGRFRHVSIVDVEEDAMSIAAALQKLPASFAPSLHFGKGDSARQFLAELEQPSLWNTSRQKLFRDLTPSIRPPDAGSGVVKVA